MLILLKTGNRFNIFSSFHHVEWPAGNGGPFCFYFFLRFPAFQLLYYYRLYYPNLFCLRFYYMFYLYYKYHFIALVFHVKHVHNIWNFI